MSDDDNSEEPRSGGMRLQKFLAAAGIGSRRNCEEYIRNGRVTIDGEVVTELGVRVDPARQEVRLDGERVRAESKRYYLVNKPPGYVCTNRDPAGRPRAVDLVPQEGARLFTVGRLDAGSRGLLLVTNDGDLAQRLAHPRFGVQRRYCVQVAGNPTRETLDRLKEGLYFAEGKFRFRQVRRLRSKGKSTFLELVLTEGRNREIRRLLARVGHKVLSLQRVGFGPLKLGRLGEGKFRPLRGPELKALRDMMQREGPGGPRSKKGKKRSGSRPAASRKRKRR